MGNRPIILYSLAASGSLSAHSSQMPDRSRVSHTMVIRPFSQRTQTLSLYLSLKKVAYAESHLTFILNLPAVHPAAEQSGCQAPRQSVL